ncbi:MAG: hypothetical protein ABH859_05900 [Pseudomonadota bacterium]
MLFKKLITFSVIVVFSASCFYLGCAKEDHWGQELRLDKKWWKKEGHSWDRKEKIFMAIGYSNPDWTDKFDLRKSADLNARAEVASFMQSLTTNYIQEIRNSNYAISESIVESSADETLLGAAIVARHYDKKKKQFQALIKIDLNYFFSQVYDQFKRTNAAKIKSKNRGLSGEELDLKIEENTQAALQELKKMEEPVIEKSMQEEN